MMKVIRQDEVRKRILNYKVKKDTGNKLHIIMTFDSLILAQLTYDFSFACLTHIG